MPVTRIIRRADIDPSDLAHVRFAEQRQAGPVIGDVEDQVPLPSPRPRKAQNPITQAVAVLAVGQSLVIKNASKWTIRACASYAGRRTGARFVVRPEGSAYRIWRKL